MNNDSKVMTFTTDILVIGGGFSGMWAARKARDFVEDVLIVDKGPRDWGGLGGMSGGDLIVKMPEDDINRMLEELVYYYDGLVEQDTMEKLLHDSELRFRDYLAMGHTFRTDAEGNFVPIPQRGLKLMRSYHSIPFGKGGANFRTELVREMDRLGVRRIGRIYITNLIKVGDRVAGAVGFHTLSGQPCAIRARAVVLTMNMGGWKTSYHMNSCAGDGVPLACEAGIPLRNFEFIRVWNTPRLFAWEGQTNMLPLGARFVNAEGEDFMKKYSARYGAKGDPHYNVRGMAHEAMAGKAPIFFDTSPLSPESLEAVRPRAGWMKLHYEKLKTLGVDFFAGRYEWIPQVITSYGGVLCGSSGDTPVAGLYAAGRTRSLDGGVYMGGLSLILTATSGYWAGEGAGRYVQGQESSPGWDEAQAREKTAAVLAPLGRPGIAPKDVVRRMQEIISACGVCILKTGKALQAGLEQTEEVSREILPGLGAADPHYLVKLREAMAMTQLTELTIRASLFRTESRAGHYRADFPDRDNENWLCWVVAEYRDGAFHFRKLPVPIDRYRVKPGECYMDSFTFPRLRQ